ncbi:MAG: response regulator transcription factor [Sulfuricella sp.]|nr:response regulator transcription factor [Sulfuricella sp.]
MKVFIVEDAELMRQHLVSMLVEIPGIKISGYAVNETSAIAHVDEVRPDVVILDLSLQDGSGISVLEHIKKNRPETKVMVLTNYTDDFYFNRCKRAGADYFFDKSFQFMKVGAALWQLIHAGRSGVDPEV